MHTNYVVICALLGIYNCLCINKKLFMIPGLYQYIVMMLQKAIGTLLIWLHSYIRKYFVNFRLFNSFSNIIVIKLICIICKNLLQLIGSIYMDGQVDINTDFNYFYGHYWLVLIFYNFFGPVFNLELFFYNCKKITTSKI